MRRLNRYIASNVVNAVLVVLLIVVSLDAIGGLMDELGSLRGNYDFTAALSYIGLTLPSRIYDNLPFSAFIGCLIGLGALANNSELTVMRAAGVSVWRLAGSVFRPALVLILIGVALGEYVTPLSDQIAESRRSLALGSKRALQADQGLWSREGREYIHVNAVLPNGVLYGLTRYTFDDDGKLLKADYTRRATFQSDYWLLEDTNSSVFHELHVQRETAELSEWQTHLTPDVLNVIVLPAEDLSIASLFRYASYLDNQNRRSDDYWLSLWRKLLQPLATLSLILIAISFVFGPMRQVTMGYRIFVGVIVGIIFQISQDMLGPASLVFGFSPLLAVLIPILGCFGVGVVLLRRAG
ncbi:MAG: LPS export ABC transporter permease LptG [Cellvibrionaceae bacterium]